MTTDTLISDPIPVADMPSLLADPHGQLARFRREAGLMRTDPRRVCALRYDDVTRLTSDPGVVQIPGARYADLVGVPPGRVAAFLADTMLMSNGEAHARRRGAFARTFAHPVIRARRGEVRSVADRIIADLPRGEVFDLHERCSSRLPAEVIAAILGLNAIDSAWFRTRVHVLARCFVPPYDLAHHDAVEAAAAELQDYITAELAARRALPRADLLSNLANDESARALADQDLVHQVMTLILAGSDTTRAAFTTVVGQLLQDRSRWDEVLSDRSLIPAAIDEALRIEPPVGTLPRFVPGPVEVAGCPVAGGQMLALLSVSAMRDETRFADPERFDLHRPDQVRPHLVFGAGAHRCLGEMLARIELEEGLAALMDAAPGLQMVEAPRMTGYGGIRQSTPLIARIG